MLLSHEARWRVVTQHPRVENAKIGPGWESKQDVIKTNKQTNPNSIRRTGARCWMEDMSVRVER